MKFFRLERGHLMAPISTPHPHFHLLKWEPPCFVADLYFSVKVTLIPPLEVISFTGDVVIYKKQKWVYLEKHKSNQQNENTVLYTPKINTPLCEREGKTPRYYYDNVVMLKLVFFLLINDDISMSLDESATLYI